METITIREYYQKTEKNIEKQTLRKTDAGRKDEEQKSTERQIVQNALEFADDAQLIIEHDTHMNK